MLKLQISFGQESRLDFAVNVLQGGILLKKNKCLQCAVGSSNYKSGKKPLTVYIAITLTLVASSKNGG